MFKLKNLQANQQSAWGLNCLTLCQKSCRQGCSAKKRGVGTPFARVPTPLHHLFWLKPNSNTKYRPDALTRKKLRWFSQSTQKN